MDKVFSGSEENRQLDQSNSNQDNPCNKLFNDFQKCMEDSKNYDYNNHNVCNQYVEMMKNMNCGK